MRHYDWRNGSLISIWFIPNGHWLDDLVFFHLFCVIRHRKQKDHGQYLRGQFIDCESKVRHDTVTGGCLKAYQEQAAKYYFGCIREIDAFELIVPVE